MTRPWTDKQRTLINRLSDEVGAPRPMRPMTAKQASADIDALLSRKRKGIFGRAATARRPTKLRLDV